MFFINEYRLNSWFQAIGNILQYEYIDDFIVKYVFTSPEGSMIRELCLQRDTDLI